MINPTRFDLGRKVVCSTDRTPEVGSICAIDDGYVFVHYGDFGASHITRAMRRDRLEWAPQS